MKIAGLPLRLALIGSAGLLAGNSAADLAPGQLATRTLEWEGLQRAFDVYRPASEAPEKGFPVVLDFHGYGSTKQQQRDSSGFRALADAEGFIGVWAQASGSPSAWNAGLCCPAANLLGVDDVGLVRAIVGQVAEETPVDSARIYATGLSNGGAISQRLACDADDLFAAVAPAAFPIPFAPLSDCQPSRPIAVSMVMGLTDIVVPYANGRFGDARESLAYWRDHNGCGAGEPDVVVPLLGDARCETYTSCNQGVETQLCSVVGNDFSAFPQYANIAGHILYLNDSGFDVAQKSWQFMSRFEHPSPPALPVPEPEIGLLRATGLLAVLALACLGSCQWRSASIRRPPDEKRNGTTA